MRYTFAFNRPVRRTPPAPDVVVKSFPLLLILGFDQSEGSLVAIAVLLAPEQSEVGKITLI